MMCMPRPPADPCATTMTLCKRKVLPVTAQKVRMKPLYPLFQAQALAEQSTVWD